MQDGQVLAHVPNAQATAPEDETPMQDGQVLTHVNANVQHAHAVVN
jgi:hypothetical protein